MQWAVVPSLADSPHLLIHSYFLIFLIMKTKKKKIGGIGFVLLPAGALPLDPLLQPFLLWLFLRKGLTQATWTIVLFFVLPS
jgi:hypothetical protein